MSGGLETNCLASVGTGPGRGTPLPTEGAVWGGGVDIGTEACGNAHRLWGAAANEKSKCMTGCVS